MKFTNWKTTKEEVKNNVAWALTALDKDRIDEAINGLKWAIKDIQDNRTTK